MALIKCPECGHEVSDKAETCPSCGYEVIQKSWAIQKSICANVSWYIFAGELVLGVLFILWLSKGTGNYTSNGIFIFAIFLKSFGWIFKLVSLAGLIFAVVSIVRKEPQKTLAWICIILHGAGLIGG